MMVVATLLASLLGLCLGILIQQSMYSLLIALMVPGVYWMIKRLTDHRNIHTIHSNTLPFPFLKVNSTMCRLMMARRAQPKERPSQ